MVSDWSQSCLFVSHCLRSCWLWQLWLGWWSDHLYHCHCHCWVFGLCFSPYCWSSLGISWVLSWALKVHHFSDRLIFGIRLWLWSRWHVCLVWFDFLFLFQNRQFSLIRPRCAIWVATLLWCGFWLHPRILATESHTLWVGSPMTGKLRWNLMLRLHLHPWPVCRSGHPHLYNYLCLRLCFSSALESQSKSLYNLVLSVSLTWLGVLFPLRASLSQTCRSHHWSGSWLASTDR